MTDSIEFDLIIAGSGLAGLRAAIEAAKKNQKIKIGVIAKTQVMRSHSVSAEGGTARQITFGEYDDVSSGIAWSKDSKTILFSSYQKPEAEYARGQSNLYSVNINTLNVKELTSREGTESSPRVSPDGSKIAFVGSTFSKNFC